MLGKRSRPTTIKKPAGEIRPAGIVECATSPRSPLDYRILSPRSPKNYDQQGGVGLGIVVALNNNNNNNNNTSNYYGGEILAKYALNGRFSSRSIPIPMNNSSTINNYNKSECDEELDDMLDEEFTYVTCHVPNKPKTTKVYYDGVAYGHATPSGIKQNLGVFTISSPATSSFDYTNSYSDFLNSCHLCEKTLHGKDIFMYRGEKAFCSEECRQSQICKEERKEQCKSEASRATDVSTSSYSYTTRGGGRRGGGHIFSPGIMAL